MFGEERARKKKREEQSNPWIFQSLHWHIFRERRQIYFAFNSRSCYHIYSSQATIFYFSNTVHFSARSLTYEMLRWAVLMDHYYISGLLYSPMSGLSLRTLRFEDRCSHFTEQSLMPSFMSVLSHWIDGVSDGLYCMIMTQHFILCYSYYCSYTDFCDMY